MSNINEGVNKSIQKILSDDVDYREKLDELQELQDISEKVTSVPTSFFACISLCLCRSSSTLKATAIQTLRYYCKDSNFISEMLRNNVTFFVAMCLERGKGKEQERIQAIKLIKNIVRIDINLLPLNLVNSLISISKHPEDELHILCLDTLCELAIMNPYTVAAANGIPTIFTSLIDVSPISEHIQEGLAVTAMYLLDDFQTRQFVRPTEILTVLSPLTDVHETPAKWNAAKSAVIRILKSWSGLIILASNPAGLKTIVDSLSLQNLELNDVVLDLLFGIFHLATPNLTIPDSIFSSYNNVELDDREKEIQSRTGQPKHNLLENYLAALLSAFNHVHLLENLLNFCSRLSEDIFIESTTEETKIKDKRNTLAIKATFLVGELLHLSNNILPPSQCAYLQMLPSLMYSAITFTQDPRLRSSAGIVVSNLHAYSHIKGTESRTKEPRLNYFSDIKKKLEWNTEELILKQKINDNVLFKKDYTQWNWEVINELIEGPLGNPVYFNMPLTAKFIKKIISFYLPSSEIYCNLPCCRANERYTKTACNLLKLIISQDNGKQVITENSILSELHDLLKTEYNRLEQNKKDEETVLSPERVLRNMSRDYFLMIGTLSHCEAGIDLLLKSQVFDQLINIVNFSKRDDLSSLIVKNLDYSWDSPSRRLLGRALSSGSTIVKFLSLKQMGALLKVGAIDYLEWGIKLIVNQLEEAQERIYKEALNILNEASLNTACLDIIISRKPYDSLLRLGSRGKEILLRFLNRQSGFKFLSTTPFINNELLHWKEMEYIKYTISLENSMNDAFLATVWKDKSGNNNTVVNLPPHLYGELAHTLEGCKLIQDNGHFEYFVNIITSPTTSNIQKRSALWVMGNIGRSTFGYKELLVKHDILGLIVHMLQNSSSLSIKGTCFNVIGIMSNTPSVAKALRSLGWDSQKDVPIAVPIKLDESGLFNIVPWTLKITTSDVIPEYIVNPYSDDDPRCQVIKSFWDLANHVTAEKALNNLKRLKAQMPNVFTDHVLYFQCITLTSWFQYESRVRRFLHHIFSIDWNLSIIESLPLIEPFESSFVETRNHVPEYCRKFQPSESETKIQQDSELEISLSNYPDTPDPSPVPDNDQTSFSASQRLKSRWSTSHDAANERRKQRGNFLLSRSSVASNVNNN